MADRVWVQLPVREIYLSLTNHPGQLSLAIPPWVGSMSTGQRAVILRLGVKADIRCCLQVILCEPYVNASGVRVDALYKSTLPLPLLVTFESTSVFRRLKQMSVKTISRTERNIKTCLADLQRKLSRKSIITANIASSNSVQK